MADSHTVRFEPVDLEMEVDEDETVLDAAFRQGIALMHGCREGQCSACKSFLIEGELQHDKYSTFALADYESEEGYVLLCKAHVYSDAVIELINYDEESLRSAVPLQHLHTKITAIEPVTHDIVSLRLELTAPSSFVFKPGQYADIRIPDHDGHRSFSMANTPSYGNQVEFLIKKYPGGHFSGLLENKLKVGDELELDGPYGSFTLREWSERRIVCIGGGAGLAPILSLLRHMVESDATRRSVSFYYGARNLADLFYLDEIKSMASNFEKFDFVPCLSDSWPDGWTDASTGGQTGFVTDAVEKCEADLTDCEIYVCGPPPMVDAAMSLLERLQVESEQIHFDKFTTSIAE